MRALAFRPVILSLAAAAAAGLAAPPASAQELDWRLGHEAVPIGSDLAEVDLNDAFVYLDRAGTEQLLELTENPLSGNELATIAAADDSTWFVIFEYDEIGYVEDGEAADLDAQAILESLAEGNESANRERADRGWGTIDIVGWEEPPHYDPDTHNLTWSLVAVADGEKTVNRQIRLLGRRGVVNATLVCDAEELPVVAAITDGVLRDFRFTDGNRYADFVPGSDRVAKVGLAALITGGAAAAALKTGLLQRFWKLLAVGGAAVVAWMGRLFGRGRTSDASA